MLNHPAKIDRQRNLTTKSINILNDRKYGILPSNDEFLLDEIQTINPRLERVENLAERIKFP
jgi:hypothetical protein